MNVLPRDPDSRSWLPLQRRQEPDETARRTFDLLAEGGSLASATVLGCA